MASTMSLVSKYQSSSSQSSSRIHNTISQRPLRLQWASLIILLVSFVFSAAATSPPQQRETLMVDSGVPTLVEGRWVVLSKEEVEHRQLLKRAAAAQDSSSELPTKSVTTTLSVVVSSATRASTSTVVPASPLPSPLDGSISSNFSRSSTGTPNNCPAFINQFLDDPTFKQCYPFSLLLQGSQSFFEAEKSLVSITQTLDAACSANVTFCNTYLARLATNLTDPANCGADYQLQNQVVVQTYMAMAAYQTLYSATCLKDPGTSAYCFANAVTNLTTPSNVYFYYLPLNISLPGSSLPSCSWCLQKTMGIYQSAAANRALPIAHTYGSAAVQVNTICGPSFVNSTLPNAVTVDSGGFSLIPQWMLLALPMFVAIQCFL